MKAIYFLITSILVTLLLPGWFNTPVMAQESVNTSGGNVSGKGGSMSYSVGQVVYKNYKSSNGSAAEGVQQPYEISVVSSFEEAKGITLSVKVYPNPATDYLMLEVKDYDFSKLHFRLYDIKGELLQNEKIKGNQTRIAVSHLVSATYLVKVIKNEREIKTFKIIKK